MTKLPKGYLKFKKKHPEVYAAYETLGKTAADGGPLDAKTRELIKLGMSAARGSARARRRRTTRDRVRA